MKIINGMLVPSQNEVRMHRKEALLPKVVALYDFLGSVYWQKLPTATLIQLATSTLKKRVSHTTVARLLPYVKHVRREIELSPGDVRREALFTEVVEVFFLRNEYDVRSPYIKVTPRGSLAVSIRESFTMYRKGVRSDATS